MLIKQYIEINFWLSTNHICASLIKLTYLLDETQRIDFSLLKLYANMHHILHARVDKLIRSSQCGEESSVYVYN